MNTEVSEEARRLIAKTVDAAPPLTIEQITLISGLLPPVPARPAESVRNNGRRAA